MAWKKTTTIFVPNLYLNFFVCIESVKKIVKTGFQYPLILLIENKYKCNYLLNPVNIYKYYKIKFEVPIIAISPNFSSYVDVFFKWPLCYSLFKSQS